MILKTLYPYSLNQLLASKVIACLLITLTLAPARGQELRTVTVRSQDYGYYYYRVDTGNRVRLTRQLSRTPCEYQRTWGYDYRGVWVDKGCEGEFEVGGGGSSSGTGSMSSDGRREIYVYSPNYRYYKYNINTDNEVELVKQLSQSACTKNQTWGYDQAGVWVDRGCSAQFLIGKRSGGSNAGKNAAIAGVVAGGVILAALLASHDKNTDSKDTGTPGSPERQAYTGAYKLGQRDRVEGRTKDYTRYRSDFDSRYDTYVRRGYEQGYDANSTANDSRPNDEVPNWMIGTFRGYSPRYQADADLTIYSGGALRGRLSNGQTVSGYYQNGRLVVGENRFYVVQEQNGFRTTQVGDEGNQVSYRRVY